MAFQILERNTVNHRNGTQTKWVKYKTDIEDVVLQFAIKCGFVNATAFCLPKGLKWAIRKETHGSRVFTHLQITSPRGGQTQVTKTELGQKFGVQISVLEEGGVEYWEHDKASGTVFCPLHAWADDSIENILRSIILQHAALKEEKPFTLTEKELQQIQNAAIEADEFDIAAAIDHKCQLETFVAMKDYLEHISAADLVFQCNDVRFFDYVPNPFV